MPATSPTLVAKPVSIQMPPPAVADGRTGERSVLSQSIGNTSMSTRKVLPILAVLFASALAGCGGGSSSSSGGPASPNGFRALLSPTFLHPRCVECHDFDRGTALAERHETRSSDCAECHDVPTWRGPVDSFSFSDLTTAEICKGIKNKFGGDIDALRDHFATSPLNAWALDSGALPFGGSRPTAPPNSSVVMLALVDRWIANGAVCD